MLPPPLSSCAWYKISHGTVTTNTGQSSLCGVTWFEELITSSCSGNMLSRNGESQSKRYRYESESYGSPSLDGKSSRSCLEDWDTGRMVFSQKIDACFHFCHHCQEGTRRMEKIKVKKWSWVTLPAEHYMVTLVVVLPQVIRVAWVKELELL